MDGGESAAALLSGPCILSEAPVEMEELALHGPSDGDAAAEDELMDAELFRDIEQLLDSGRAEIHEAYLAAIDSLGGDSAGEGAGGGGELFLPGAGDERVSTSSMAWETTRESMERLSESLAYPTYEQSDSADVDMAGPGGDDALAEADTDALFQRERELLEREAKFLEAQRDFLQFKVDAAAAHLSSLAAQQPPGGDSGGWEARAEDEQRSLEASRRHQTMLADLLAQHQKSVCALEVTLMQAPITHYRLSLMTPMESYIHLGKDPEERRATLVGLRDAKIDAVRHFIEYQSRHIDPLRDFFYLDTFDKFGKFYTVDFSVSFLANTTVAEVADIIQDQFVIPLDGVSQMLGSVSNREYFDGIEETFLHARIVDRVDVPRRKLHDRGFVVQESNAVFYGKSFPELDGFTVLTSDCVDKDELHPYHIRSRLRKDISVGITLRRHVDAATGTSGVIMKRFSFIRHHLQHREPTPELLHAISTRVILWGQAVRYFIAGRHHRRGGANQRVWNKYSFPRLPAPATTASSSTEDGFESP